jgi:hypothetical protein
MARTLRAGGPFLAAALTASLCLAGDFVILRGGARIDLKQPPVRQGNNALLTRADGALLSVPVSEVDWKATAAARTAPSPKPAPAIVGPPETPAEAARLSRRAKARIKITDEDVAHVGPSETDVTEKEKKEEGPSAARLEIADYTQEKAGPNLIIRGSLRNVGTTMATNARLTVSAIDEKGQTIGTAAAMISGTSVEPGQTSPFSGMIPVGEKVVMNLRFSPQWYAPPPPASPESAAAAEKAAAQAAGSSAAAGRPASAPAPAPTPYGRGSFYAAPAPPAATVPSPDGKTGYLPGAARKEDQPKPPQ